MSEESSLGHQRKKGTPSPVVAPHPTQRRRERPLRAHIAPPGRRKRKEDWKGPSLFIAPLRLRLRLRRGRSTFCTVVVLCCGGGRSENPPPDPIPPLLSAALWPSSLSVARRVERARSVGRSVGGGRTDQPTHPPLSIHHCLEEGKEEKSHQVPIEETCRRNRCDNEKSRRHSSSSCG